MSAQTNVTLKLQETDVPAQVYDCVYHFGNWESINFCLEDCVSLLSLDYAFVWNTELNSTFDGHQFYNYKLPYPKTTSDAFYLLREVSSKAIFCIFLHCSGLIRFWANFRLVSSYEDFSVDSIDHVQIISSFQKDDYSVLFQDSREEFYNITICNGEMHMRKCFSPKRRLSERLSNILSTSISSFIGNVSTGISEDFSISIKKPFLGSYQLETDGSHESLMVISIGDSGMASCKLSSDCRIYKQCCVPIEVVLKKVLQCYEGHYVEVVDAHIGSTIIMLLQIFYKTSKIAMYAVVDVDSKGEFNLQYYFDSCLEASKIKSCYNPASKILLLTDGGSIYLYHTNGVLLSKLNAPIKELDSHIVAIAPFQDHFRLQTVKATFNINFSKKGLTPAEQTLSEDAEPSNFDIGGYICTKIKDLIEFYKVNAELALVQCRKLARFKGYKLSNPLKIVSKELASGLASNSTVHVGTRINDYEIFLTLAYSCGLIQHDCKFIGKDIDFIVVCARFEEFYERFSGIVSDPISNVIEFRKHGELMELILGRFVEQSRFSIKMFEDFVTFLYEISRCSKLLYDLVPEVRCVNGKTWFLSGSSLEKIHMILNGALATIQNDVGRGEFNAVTYVCSGGSLTVSEFHEKITFIIQFIINAISFMKGDEVYTKLEERRTLLLDTLISHNILAVPMDIAVAENIHSIIYRVCRLNSTDYPIEKYIDLPGFCSYTHSQFAVENAWDKVYKLGCSNSPKIFDENPQLGWFYYYEQNDKTKAVLCLENCVNNAITYSERRKYLSLLYLLRLSYFTASPRIQSDKNELSFLEYLVELSSEFTTLLKNIVENEYPSFADILTTFYTIPEISVSDVVSVLLICKKIFQNEECSLRVWAAMIEREWHIFNSSFELISRADLELSLFYKVLKKLKKSRNEGLVPAKMNLVAEILQCRMKNCGIEEMTVGLEKIKEDVFSF